MLEYLLYKLCFKLLKTFRLLHKTVDSRDCGASEHKQGKYRRKKRKKSEFQEKKVPYTMLQHLLKHFKNYFNFIMHVNLKHRNKIDVNSESD